MKSSYLSILFFLVGVSLAGSLNAQEFHIQTDSTGRPFLTLPDGSITYKHPALDEYQSKGFARAQEKIRMAGNAAPWQEDFDKARSQMNGSRVCYAGAVVLPLVITAIPSESGGTGGKAYLAGASGLLLAIIGLGLDAASHNHYQRAIHLHIDSGGVGVGIPLQP